jgi:hypothetical protein
MTVFELLYYVTKIADAKYDGHYTLHKFPTGYGGYFGTAQILDFHPEIFSELMPCLENMILFQPNAYDLSVEAEKERGGFE